MKNQGQFRFTFFTNKYVETLEFYKDKLGFNLEHIWDRNQNDKGALFQAGNGLIEVMKFPNTHEIQISGLDYRTPQGVFMCIQVWNIDELYDKYKSINIPFKQEITNQSWGHRSFSITEPNGLILFFFQEQF
ncbi:MAG: VOC family protein [Flaviramulus sp.]|nr:VOC family protein [Flaviramulus sp.]